MAEQPQDVAPGQDPTTTEQQPREEGYPPAGDLQLDEASGAEVPDEDAGRRGAGRDDVPVFEDPNER